jgi:hypothetical protein
VHLWRRPRPLLGKPNHLHLLHHLPARSSSERRSRPL